MSHTDFPTRLIDLAHNGKVLGTVMMMSNNGQIRVSNSEQYDEGTGAVIVRGVPNNVDVWYDVEARTFGSDRMSFTRRDKFMVNSSAAAKSVMRDAIATQIRGFLATEEGAEFVKAGRIVAARNAVERAERVLEEAREAERAATRDLVEKTCALARLTGKV